MIITSLLAAVAVAISRAPPPRLSETAAAAPRYAIGVDVGTGSARAGVVDVRDGTLLGVHKQDITMWNPLPEHYEQSSEDIWAAVCNCVRGALSAAGATADEVCGVAFDATCSLVLLDSEGAPVGIDPTVPDEARRNVIVWMDHRSEEQAARINRGGHARLANVGGAVSPEMEVPKLLWLRDEMPHAFHAAATAEGGGKALDLADFLAYAATDGSQHARSLCTVVCKWNYDASPAGGGPEVARAPLCATGWDRSFFESVGRPLGEGDLPEAAIGKDVLPPGAALGGGVGPSAAEALGLRPGTPVGVGMIDAHAGGVGSLGAALPREAGGGEGGTSTCHMASSHEPVFVRGVWGPYYGAMFPSFNLNEGGQSAAGAFLDFVIASHPAGAAAIAAADAAGEPVAARLNRRRGLAAARRVPLPTLASDVHVTPDVNGNRSPLADPAMRAPHLALRSRPDELAVVYLAAVQSLAYQTRQIVEAMQAAGHPTIGRVFVCGGLSKNPLYVSSHADALRLPLHIPTNDEAVLLGAAVLAATAGGAHASVSEAAAAMTSVGRTVRPAEEGEVAAYHARKYAVFLKMTEDQREYREMMAS
ncbi:hypothetical protein EMIHUDRAFT_60950 [Emiliania huxleyi CCMP1516]|uniref:FGGY carbohydrate kinase domain-containing protein n=2 Tax=Emiliania huxleyi TaxID=2903 RepID=A0A0D3L1R2_EMIH1|nr:hypothetical protein EMIHUDRAFT_60950 [Emiliania huxleyi CCMP1516]EOD41947.1 hypothetical protein EMIHUDRAFT_60950 [Emiliania huxleyi CCMP1516]|eukprot:XP_005794376.1 hypothetical protein EMIHUDRAFT_60950 [Emiliania huxleyi CCMP1516]